MHPPRWNKNLSRREFLGLLATLGGGTLTSGILAACARAGITPPTEIVPSSTPDKKTPTQIAEPATRTATQKEESPQMTDEPTSTPTETVASPLAQVAFVKTTDRAEGVRQAIDLLGFNPVEGKRVFLKPNFNSADPTPGSTHPDVLRTLVSKMNNMGAARITVGDRSGMGNTRQVMERLGVFSLADELGFDMVVFDDLSADDWEMFQPRNSHWTQGFPFARPCLEADTIIQTCCLKTHRYGGHFTLSLKNSVGMVAKNDQRHSHDFMQELHSSDYQRAMIAEINTAYSPGLVILDGVEAFISGGPANGERVSSQVILAGTDRIAIDAVGVALLRYHGCQTNVAKGEIFQQEQIARAIELSLGIDKPEKIELITGDPESAAYAEQIKDILLKG